MRGAASEREICFASKAGYYTYLLCVSVCMFRYRRPWTMRIRETVWCEVGLETFVSATECIKDVMPNADTYY